MLKFIEGNYSGKSIPKRRRWLGNHKENDFHILKYVLLWKPGSVHIQALHWRGRLSSHSRIKSKGRTECVLKLLSHIISLWQKTDHQLTTDLAIVNGRETGYLEFKRMGWFEFCRFHTRRVYSPWKSCQHWIK